MRFVYGILLVLFLGLFTAFCIGWCLGFFLIVYSLYVEPSLLLALAVIALYLIMYETIKDREETLMLFRLLVDRTLNSEDSAT